MSGENVGPGPDNMGLNPKGPKISAEQFQKQKDISGFDLDSVQEIAKEQENDLASKEIEEQAKGKRFSEWYGLWVQNGGDPSQQFDAEQWDKMNLSAKDAWDILKRGRIIAGNSPDSYFSQLIQEEGEGSKKEEEDYLDTSPKVLLKRADGSYEEGWSFHSTKENGEAVLRRKNPGAENGKYEEITVPESEVQLSSEGNISGAEAAEPKPKNSILDIVRDNRINDLSDPNVLREALGLPEEFTAEEKDAAVKEFGRKIAQDPELASSRDAISQVVSAEALGGIKTKEQKEASEKSKELSQKLDKEYDEYITGINKKIQEKGWPSKPWAKFLRNSSTRIAAGIITGITASAFVNTPGGAAAKYGAMALRTGLASFGFGSGAEAGKIARIRRENQSFFEDCKIDGKIDREKVVQKFNSLSAEQQTKMVASLVEVSNRRAEKIDDKLYQEEQDTIAKAEKNYSIPRQKFEKLRENFSKLSWKKKLVVSGAIALVSVGAGAVAGGALAGVGIYSAASSVAGIGVSGLINVGASMVTSSRDSRTKYSSDSELINILGREYFQGQNYDKDRLSEERKKVGKDIVGSRIKGIAFGGALANAMNIVNLGRSAYQHAAGEGSQHSIMNTYSEKHIGSSENKPHLEEGTNTPQEKHIAGVSPEQMAKGPTLHLKDGYFKNPENIGVNADKHLAENVIRGYMGRNNGHFENHNQFNAARDALAREWREKGFFSADGKLNIEPDKLIHSIDALGEAKAAVGAAAPEYFHSGAGETLKSGAEQHLTNHNGNIVNHENFTGEKAVQHAAEKANTEPIDPSGFQWKAGRLDLFENSQSTHLNRGQLDQIFEKGLLKPHAEKYLHNLIDSGRIKPDQVIITPDHKHLMFSDTLLSKKLAWDTSFKDTFLGIGSKLKATVDGIISPGPDLHQGVYTVVDQQPKIDGMGVQPSQHDSSGEQVYIDRDAAIQPSEPAHHIEPPTAPPPHLPRAESTPTVPDLPDNSESYSSSVIDHIDNAKNYLVNIQGQEPVNVSGDRLNQLVEEAKKYFTDNHAVFSNSLKERESINLYILGHLKK